jgi:hypothetical protein
MEHFVKTPLIILAILTTIISTNASALQLMAGTTLMPSLASTVSLQGGHLKIAEQIVKDSQDYRQSGTISILLGQNIKNLLNEDKSLSESEAVDQLNTASLTILNQAE